MPDSSPFWLCHECGAQMRPITVNGVPHCASCNGEFLEILDTDVNPDPFHDLPPPPPTRPGAAVGSPSSPRATSPDPGAGGAGFLQSLLGGILGAAAGPGSPSGDGRQEGSYGNRAGSPTGQQQQQQHRQGGSRTWEFNFPGGGRGQVMFGSFGGSMGGGGAQMGPFGPVGDNGDPLGSFFPGFNPPRPSGERLNNALGAGQPPDGLEMLRALLAAVEGDGNAPPNIFFGGPAGRANFGDYATSERGFNDILEQLMQAAGPQGPLPASDIVIDGLPRFKFDEPTLEKSVYKDCPVCKDDFVVGDEVMRIPCAHIFHPDCLQPWLKVNGSCPVCRFSLVPQEPDHAASPDPSNPSQPQPPPAGTPGAQTATNPASPASPTTEGQSTMTSILNRLFGQSGNSNPTTPVGETSQSPFGLAGPSGSSVSETARTTSQGPPTAAQSGSQTQTQTRPETLPAASGQAQADRQNRPAQVDEQDAQVQVSTDIPEDYRARHRERERQRAQSQQQQQHEGTGNDYVLHDDLD